MFETTLDDHLEIEVHDIVSAELFHRFPIHKLVESGDDLRLSSIKHFGFQYPVGLNKAHTDTDDFIICGDERGTLLQVELRLFDGVSGEGIIRYRFYI